MASSRHFGPPSSTLDGWPSFSPSEADAHARQLVRRSAAALQAWLQGQGSGQPRDDDVTVYTGAAGAAMLLLRHADRAAATGDKKAAVSLRTLALASLGRCQTLAAAKSHMSHVPSFVLGVGGILALRAVAAERLGDTATRDTAVSLLCSLGTSAPMLRDDSGTLPCEVLYGRAGFLLACAYVNAGCNGTARVPDEVTAPVVETVRGGEGGGGGGGRGWTRQHYERTHSIASATCAPVTGRSLTSAALAPRAAAASSSRRSAR
jgi:hypothetical protein